MKDNIRVLLIEADLDYARQVQTQLGETRQNTEVTTTSSLESGIVKLRQYRWDTVLLNLNLPDSKGLDTLRQIYNAAPGVPIVVITASDSDDLALEVLRNGAQEYIIKETTQLNLLNRIIKTAIERKTSFERMKLNEAHQREDFAAMLAHDLKTPVSGANRIYDLLLEGWLGPLSAGQLEIVAKLRESNLSLLRLIQNMLEVYKFEQSKQQIHLEDFELLPLLVDCVHHFGETAKRNQMHITSKFPETIGTMRADPAAIRRLFLNGLDNAIKFSPAGGTIVVSAQVEAKMVTITIADQGPGIPQQQQSQLFERFWVGGAGTKYTAGTGLGLYLCKRIVEAHGGDIYCDSTEGRGTTFVIKLPLVTRTKKADKDQSDSVAAPEENLPDPN